MAIQRKEYDDSMDRLIGQSIKVWVNSENARSAVRRQVLAKAAASRRARPELHLAARALAVLHSFVRHSHLDEVEAVMMLRVPGGVGYEYKRRSLTAANRTMESNYLPLSSIVFMFS